ncbi:MULTISPECIES: ATP-dependent helicase [unclassified Rothia (in: high G+C Gram-positive bacteria)]|uniref:ATP-dependent helicase n=1 Tax=unclassified Rothia (in: high G+C Gram-positive bacteria) TaxID=2689056 RepID=UPI0019592FAF|nr:ATP-dependent helicase [Rothia sp. ZJ932]MBM7051069.1 ATP-dependent helicase [Rothia sp. ZJ1223]QRZ62228.1 ATP-dependent helicase [Rothia sp. ZJ932]
MSITPLAVSAITPEKILEGLDPEQRRVATELEGPMCVLAGAGTGKTRAITHRIAYGIAIGRYVPQRVLALTFTNRAADEMRVRLRQLGAVGVQTRTFHAAALRQVQYFWPQAVGGPPPTIVPHKAQLITEAANRLRLTTDRATVRDLAAQIEWAKVKVLTPDTLLPHLEGRALPNNMSALDLVRLYRTYEELKDERHLIDFEDVLLLAVSFLEDDETIAAAVRSQYRHFVVDEYQDVSPLQQRLLTAWLGNRNDLCVVGDASQTIYSFTGATSRFLTEFRTRYENAQQVKLVRDYRSTHTVVELANTLLNARKAQRDSTPGSWAKPLELVAQCGTGPAADWIEAADDEDEAHRIARDIKELISYNKVHARDIAVLFRTNAQSAALEQALSEHGINYQLRGAEQFFARPEVRNALTLLRNSAQAQTGEKTPNFVRDVLKSLGYSDKAPASSGAVRAKWESLAALVSMADSLTAVRDKEIEQAQSNGASELPAPLSLHEFVAHLAQRLANQDAPSMDGVTLASLHAAKGLEWEAVYLCGLNEGLMPISFAKTSDDIDEERRLLYVGITRARKYITFSWSLSRTPGGRPNRKRSRFLDALAPQSIY